MERNVVEHVEMSSNCYNLVPGHEGKRGVGGYLHGEQCINMLNAFTFIIAKPKVSQLGCAESKGKG